MAHKGGSDSLPVVCFGHGDALNFTFIGNDAQDAVTQGCQAIGSDPQSLVTMVISVPKSMLIPRLVTFLGDTCQWGEVRRLCLNNTPTGMRWYHNSPF
jgi:hypothetical protein